MQRASKDVFSLNSILEQKHIQQKYMAEKPTYPLYIPMSERLASTPMKKRSVID